MPSETGDSEAFALESEDAKLLLGDAPASVLELEIKLRRRKRIIRLQWAIIAFLLMILSVWTISVADFARCRKCSELFFALSPAMASILERGYHDDTINGSLHYRSRWQGYPNDDVDAAWHSIVNEGFMRISFEDARVLGKSLSDLVQVPQDLTSSYGEGVVVSSDMAHQLHCLNMIRMYTYEDYYRNKTPVPLLFQQDETKILRGHIDHCIDILRQNIMCTADASLVTHKWIDGRPLMQPDFNINKKCRSFDAMMDWIGAHEVKELNTRPGYGVPRTTGD